MRILLVDDDPEIRLLAGFVLRAAGHDVVEAEDAVTARGHDPASFDLLVMDVMLGGDDGIALADAMLRGATLRPALVFLTAADSDALRARMTAAGAASIIGKPFDPEALPGDLLAAAGRA